MQSQDETGPYVPIILKKKKKRRRNSPNCVEFHSWFLGSTEMLFCLSVLSDTLSSVYAALFISNWWSESNVSRQNVQCCGFPGPGV